MASSNPATASASVSRHHEQVVLAPTIADGRGNSLLDHLLGADDLLAAATRPLHVSAALVDGVLILDLDVLPALLVDLPAREDHRRRLVAIAGVDVDPDRERTN